MGLALKLNLSTLLGISPEEANERGQRTMDRGEHIRVSPEVPSAWQRVLVLDNDYVDGFSANLGSGHSVRCVRDE